MKWTANLRLTETIVPDIEIPNFPPTADGIHHQLPGICALSESFWDTPDFFGPSTKFPYHEGVTEEQHTADFATAMHTGPSHCTVKSLYNEIVGAASSISKESLFNTSNQYLSGLEKWYKEDPKDLIQMAEALPQPGSSDNVLNHLGLCAYLASKDLLTPLAMDNSVIMLTTTDIHLTLKMLLQPRTTAVDMFMSGLLASAAKLGKDEIVQILINHGVGLVDNSALNALHLAIPQGHLKVVKILLDSGVDVRAYHNGSGFPAIDAAILECNEELVQVFLDKDPKIISSDPSQRSYAITMALERPRCTASFVKFLLTNGADFNSPFIHKLCLRKAAEAGKFEIVRCLLTAGAVNRSWWSEEIYCS